MRYAILSDIHANSDALHTVLVDAHDFNVEKLICLGDVVGYGPDPASALEEVYTHFHVCLAGNHDDAVCGRRTCADFNDFAATAVRHHQKALTSKALAWLKRLPYVYATTHFACTHGSFDTPESFNYIQELEEAQPSFALRAEQLLFVGHTHKPGVIVREKDGPLRAFGPIDFRLEEGRRYLVNVGSVGYPRSGACRSTYCVYDDVTHTVYFRSLPFDLEGYRAKMNGKGLDEAPWMTVRAAQRATPCVRRQAHFAHSAKYPKLVGALLVLLALGLGAAAVFAFKAPLASAPSTPSPRAVVAPAPRPESKPHDETTQVGLITNLVISVQDVPKVFFALRLTAQSHPAKARLTFRDQQGQLLPDSEVTYPPFTTSLTRASEKTGVRVPPHAVTARLEVARTVDTGFCALTQCTFSTHVLKKERKKK